MAKRQTYPMEKVLAAREVLRQLPAKEKEKSRAELVKFLQADLRKSVLTPPTLAKYLSEFRRRNGQKPNRPAPQKWTEKPQTDTVKPMEVQAEVVRAQERTGVYCHQAGHAIG